MYLTDLNNNVTKTVSDDGTYIIQNDTVVGRQDLEEGMMATDLKKKSEMESIPIYLSRIAFLIACILILMFILLVLISMAGLLCILITEKYAGQDESRIHIEVAMRNGRIMNMMRSIPYSTFMLRTARDCPICLDSFNDDSLVV